MSVTKFVRAQDILKEKGFKAPPFDTAGFQNAVVEYFKEHEVSAKLEVVSMRFINYTDAPKCGFSMAERVVICAPNMYEYYRGKGAEIVHDEHLANQVKDEVLEIDIADGDKMFLMPAYRCPGMEKHILGDWRDTEKRYYLRYPIVVVDEPYATNAVALLKMAGFIVSRKHRWRNLPSYTVTLV